MLTGNKGTPIFSSGLAQEKNKPLSQRTPGPWVFVRGYSSFLVYSTSDRRQLICSTNGNGSNDEENARLTAAAPALLDAAKEILAVNDYAKFKEAINGLVNAVKLAEGITQ